MPGWVGRAAPGEFGWHLYRIYSDNYPSLFDSAPRKRMNVIIYGITGHRELRMPLENLEVEDLEVGREFVFDRKIYEIRSLTETDEGILMNVVIVME